MAAKLLLVSLLLAGTVLAVQSQLEPTRRSRFRPKLRRTTPSPTPEDNVISNDLNLSKDEANELIVKLSQSSSRRTGLPPKRPRFKAKRPSFRRPQKQPLGRSRFTEATPVVETTTESKRNQFVPKLRKNNPRIPERPFKGQSIGGEVTLDSGIRSPNEQIEVVKFKPTKAAAILSIPGSQVEGSGLGSSIGEDLLDSLSQEREDFRQRKEERDRIAIALATEQPFENSIDIQTTERPRSLKPIFKRPSDRDVVLPFRRKATKRRRGRPVATPATSLEARILTSPVARPAASPVARPVVSPVARPAASPVARPLARPEATEAAFVPSSATEPRNILITEDPLQALLRRASSMISSSNAESATRASSLSLSSRAESNTKVIEQPRNNEENEITDRRIGVRRRVPGRSGGRKSIQSVRRKPSQSSRDFIRQDRNRLRSRARIPLKRPVAKIVDSDEPISNTIGDQKVTIPSRRTFRPEKTNFNSFPSTLASSSPRRPTFQPRIRVSQASKNDEASQKETILISSLENQLIQTESIGSIGTIPITESFSQTIPATEAFRDEIVLSTSRPQPTTPFLDEPIQVRAQPTPRPQPSVAEPRPRTTITRPLTSQLQSLPPGGKLDFQIPLEFDPFSLTTPGTPAFANFTRRPFVRPRPTTPAPQPPRRVTQRPRVFPEAPRSIQESVPAVPEQRRILAQTTRQFTNFAQSENTRQLLVPSQPQTSRRLPAPAQAQAPRRLPIPAPIPAQPQAPRRLPIPAPPQAPQRLPFPAPPQAPRRLPVPASPQASSQPAVPVPPGINGITQLRNNNFAAFDRQFGGAVPFTAFRSTGSTTTNSQTTTPQVVNGNRFANTNIALLQNQNTLIQPQNSFQSTPIQRAQPERIAAPSVQIQRIQPGIQLPPRVVPQNFQFPFSSRDQTFRVGGQPQSFQRFAPQQFQFQTAASQNTRSLVPQSPPQFQAQAPQPQQLQFQAAASQNVPVTVRQPLNLPPNTFFGHPASNIDLNTGSFSISTR